MATSSSLSRRQFVSLAAGAAGAALVPGGWPASLAQDPMIDSVATAGRSASREKVAWTIEPFPLQQVRLLQGPFYEAMEINRRWLHALPADRLLHTFRLNAGLPSSAEPLGGWEKPDSEVRGHFSGGHYLSACALTYASTGDEALRRKAEAMVEELARCQAALKDGYLSAFPEEFFDRLRDGRPVWAPFYTLHKILAGHLDMYAYCGNQQALATAEKMAAWIGRWTEPLSDAHMQRVLEVEQGGTMEGLCNLYAVTGKDEYLATARRFDHHAVFDPLAAYRDELKGLHANTNIPKITGAARQYELTGDQRYHDVASYFWHEVTARRVYCTGGTSYREHWEADAGHLGGELGQDMEECCCGYNLLKLTRHLFGWTADPWAMDYYERTLFNSRLGTEDPSGMKSYFLPLAAGYWKYYNSPWDSFWCCTATGAEEFSKFGDTIYFRDAHGVYVNLFIPSEVSWPEKGWRLRQETSFPEQAGTSLVVRAEKPVTLTLNIRAPGWATEGGTVKLNGGELTAFSSPSSYLALRRTWQDGDRVEVSLPMTLHVEALPGNGRHQAVLYGPLVLAGRLGNEGLTPAMTYVGYNTSPGGRPAPVSSVTASRKEPGAWVEPVSGEALAFRTLGQPQTIRLAPLYRIAGERYVVYWTVET